MLIQTPWTLTWGGVSLLSAGDLIQDEVKGPSGEGKYDTLTPLRGPFTVRTGRGLVTHTMSFHRTVRFTTGAGAKIFALAHAIQLASLASHVGTAPNGQLNAIAGGSWLLGNVGAKWAITTYADRCEIDYQLEFGAFVQTVAPPDPDPPAAPSTLVTDTGDTVVTDTGDTRVTVD